MHTQHAKILPDDYRAFSQTLEGKVRSRHHAEYAGWYYSSAWNRRHFERFPEYIVRAASIDDVVKSVNFARLHGLRVAVKGSGHSYAGSFLHRGGLLLDLAQLNAIDVDAEQATVSAGPGVNSAQLSHALAPHGLAFPTGHGAKVGLSGFLLGGGLGINCDAWGGMSTFNIRALDVVTADGQLLHVNETENPELLWAARGGGPCLFFVVVQFHLKTWPAPKAMLSRSYAVDTADLKPLLLALCARRDDHRVQVMLALGGAVGVPAGLSVSVFCDDAGEASGLQEALRRDVAPWLGDVAEQVLDNFEPIYRQTEQAMVSKRYRADNILTDAAGKAADVLVAGMRERPSPATFSLLILRPNHEHDDAAYSIHGRVSVSTYAQWDDEDADALNRDWLRAVYDQLATHANGSYINEFDLEGRSDEVAVCYSADAWRRLRKLRQQHDPSGIFPGVSLLAADVSERVA